MSYIQPRTLDNLPHPFFVATEGMGDARLIDELLMLKGITNCSVGCPSRDSAKGKTGKDGFADYFRSIQLAQSRATSVRLRGLLVVADADDNAAKTFDQVLQAVTAAGFPVPPKPFEIDGVAFRSAVYLLPGQGRNGTLEHLLLDAAIAAAPHLSKCLDEFSACTGRLRSAKANNQAKMRMSALAAAFCENNAWCAPNTMLRDPNTPVPINSTYFDPLTDFLQKFSE